jgi:hypothetical protein
MPAAPSSAAETAARNLPGNGVTMPKKQVTDRINDLITDREMTYAHLLQSGTMTDRQAAEAAGLNPDTASYTKSKPCVRAYMRELCAALQQQFVQQEAEGLQRQSISREQVLDRLWEIARMSPEATRNSVTGQVKALSIIAAIEGFTPDRRAAEKKSAKPLPRVNIYRAPWLPNRPGDDTADPPSPDFAAQQEEPAVPDPPPAVAPAMESSELNLAHSPTPANTNPWVPEATGFAYTPDPRTAFSIPRKAFGRRR